MGGGGLRLEYGGGGAKVRILGGRWNSQQAHAVITTSMRRNDVTTSH